MILLAAAGAGPYNPFLDLEIWSFISFLLLAGVIVYFGGPKLLVAMRNREKQILENLKMAELAAEEARSLREQQAKERQSWAGKSKELLEEAHRDAERTKAELLAVAQREAEHIRKRAEREISLHKMKVFQELYILAADISAQATSRVLSQRLTAEDHRQLIGEAIADIGRAGEDRAA